MATKITNDNITSVDAAKLTGTLPAISGANLTGIDALPAVGSSGNVLTSDGNNWASTAPAGGGFTLGTEQATTSGSAKIFTGIPAGTKLIILMAEEVSIGSGTLNVTIGDSGGLETSGYLGENYLLDGAGAYMSTAATFTTANWLIATNSTFDGTFLMTMALKDSSANTWIVDCQAQPKSYNQRHLLTGSKSLSGELTQVSINASPFDAGSVNIMYQ